MKILATLSTAVFIAAAPAAIAETFECTLKDSSNSGWLPKQLVFELNDTKNSAQIYDPITYSTTGAVVAATIQIETSVRINLKWKTGGLSQWAGHADAGYWRAIGCADPVSGHVFARREQDFAARLSGGL